MTRNLRDAVVVVTGASSGIGRATAEAFARKGATVVLAARREISLAEVAEACDRLGGRGRPYVLDVTDEEAVRELARWTVEHHGRVDVWVNNAAVYLVSRFEETPPDAFRRVIETNFFGYVHGMRAVLLYMREQDGGVIVNVASLAGRTTQPYTGAYVASKHAVRGLSGSLRQELRGTNVHVCTINPAVIDTPLFQHAGNYTGRRVKPMNPVNAAEQVANAIVSVAERPRAEVMVGTPGLMMSLMHALMPGLAERQMAAMVEADHFADEPAPSDDGNLYQPVAVGTEVSGGWGTTAPPPIAQKALAVAAGAATAALPILLMSRSGRSRPSG